MELKAFEDNQIEGSKILIAGYPSGAGCEDNSINKCNYCAHE